MTRDIADYEATYLSDYGFESVMVAYRRCMLLERLKKYQPRYVVEVGCGADLLYRHYLEQGGQVTQWLAIEPGSQFATQARATNLPGFDVLEGFFEQLIDEVKKFMACPPDMVICSGVLHEVPDATKLLVAIHEVMERDTILHVNVPNAESLHRRLAQAMGLIVELKTMSQRNLALQQHRVFDRTQLLAYLAETGFEILETGGYLVKPFTHAQMEAIAPLLGQPVLDGLFQMGKTMPELASEIFAEVRRV